MDHDPRKPAYIATQGPLPSTTGDFWQVCCNFFSSSISSFPKSLSIFLSFFLSPPPLQLVFRKYVCSFSTLLFSVRLPFHSFQFLFPFIRTISVLFYPRTLLCSTRQFFRSFCHSTIFPNTVFPLSSFTSNMYYLKEEVVTSVVNPITQPNVVVGFLSLFSTLLFPFSSSSPSDGLGTRITNDRHVDSMYGIRKFPLSPLLARGRIKSTWKLRSSPGF